MPPRKFTVVGSNPSPPPEPINVAPIEPTLEELEAQQLALQEKIALTKAKKLEEAKLLESIKAQKELSKPVIITFTRIHNNYIFFKNEPYRQDILDYVKNIEGRMWKAAERENAIPLGMYEAARVGLLTLQSITIEYAEGVEKAIKDELYAPDFVCDLGDKHLIVKTSRKAYSYPLREIPGYQYDYTNEVYKFPLSEGWRLFEFSKRENIASNFVWTDSAKDFVLLQIENRLRLDEIAKATDIELEIPLLQATLKNFQKIGIKFFELNGGRGILGDEMGTGKTLQMIGLAVHNKWKLLVICPATLKENWLREVRKFAPHLTTYTCQGETPLAFDIVKLIKEPYDVVFINYDILASHIIHKKETKREDGTILKEETKRFPWVEALNMVGFDLAVADEGHYIKNVDSARSQAVRKIQISRFISMTGTPILNRPGELWPLLHIADPITFPAFETFKQQYTYDGKVVRNVEQLKQLLKPLMIRRLKKDVIKELPPINRLNSYFELSEKGRKLYDRVLSGIFDVLSTWSPNQAGSEKTITNMLVQIQRLKQVVAIDGIDGTAELATQIFDASPSEDEPNKVLIFSQFKATTYAISRRLGGEALSFVTLSSGKEFVTSHYTEQQKLIDQFQSDPSIHFLCVTEKTAKEGHNITAAKAVIFNDLFWTPAGHQQAEGRAYGRISDLHTIDSYYRIGVNSISEKIMELLAAKLQLIEQVVEGVEAARMDTSIVHELISSLKEEMWTIKKK